MEEAERQKLEKIDKKPLGWGTFVGPMGEVLSKNQRKNKKKDSERQLISAKQHSNNLILTFQNEE